MEPVVAWANHALVVLSAKVEAAYQFMGSYFRQPSSLTSDVSIFGFSEFISALALLVIVYTISDIRYKFRLNIAPLPLFMLTYISFAIIGIATLFIDVWTASGWPVLDIPLNRHVIQGGLGFLFLFLTLAWIFFARGFNSLVQQWA